MVIRVSINDAKILAEKALFNSGVNSEDIGTIVDHLLDGELGGHPSHGFYRIPSIINAINSGGVRKQPEIVDESSNSTLICGHNTPGLVVALKATDTAIAKAKDNLVAVVGANTYIGTTGAMGYYTRRIADNNLIGIMMANSEASIPAWGGKQPIFGTNPISIAIPSQNEPIVADLASSTWSYGDIALAMKESRELPLGVVLDVDGNDSTDPNDADTGSMLPFGGHKGYALALAFELLAGPLVKAKAGAYAVQGSDGLLIIALNPSMFVSVEQFKEQVSSLIVEIKASAKRPGVTQIFYPGERSHIKRQESQQMGYIELLDQVYDDLVKLASKQQDG